LPGFEIKIVNENGDELPPNESGEIIISGAAVMKGYLNNEKETQNKLKNNFYFSGDIGYKDENGFLFIEARRSDLIITGGENVNPAEAEKLILQISNIKECAVFGLPDPEWGHIVCAAIVLNKNEEISAEKIRDILKKETAGFKIPRKIFFVDELPKTPLGKIQREKIKDIFDK
jgi:acyl-CoA synthetase (AMP-forming)/AMP-acid ligase II